MTMMSYVRWKDWRLFERKITRQGCDGLRGTQILTPRPQVKGCLRSGRSWLLAFCEYESFNKIAMTREKTPKPRWLIWTETTSNPPYVQKSPSRRLPSLLFVVWPAQRARGCAKPAASCAAQASRFRIAEHFCQILEPHISF